MNRERVLLLVLLALVPCGNAESPKSEDAPLRMLSTSSHLNVIEGSSVLLPCNVMNIERRVRIWKHLPGRILFSGSITVSRDPKISLVNGSSLQIDDITPEYSGEYLCFVSYHLFVNVTHRIDVLVPPLVYPDPPSGEVVVLKGSSASMMCNVTGSPKPVVSWSYEQNGTWFMSLPSGVRQVEGTRLHIASVDVLHTGKYTCRADNEVGKPVDASFELTVLYAPEVRVSPSWAHGDEGASAEFRCVARGAPAAQPQWVRGGVALRPSDRVRLREEGPHEVVLRVTRMTNEDLGKYACVAKNLVGETTQTVEISGLAEPVQIRGNESGEDSYLLLWSTKSYSPIIEYQLRIRKHKSGESWTDVVIPVSGDSPQSLFFSQAYNVTGLQPATRYEAVLQAHNNFGWNRPSDTLLFSIGPVELVEESTVLTLLPLYDESDIDITDPTFLKQEISSRSNLISPSSIMQFFLIVLSCLMCRSL